MPHAHTDPPMLISSPKAQRSSVPPNIMGLSVVRLMSTYCVMGGGGEPVRAAQGAGRAVGSCARSTPGGGAFGLPAPQKRTASGLPVACATALLRSATIWLALTRSPGTAAVGRRRQWLQVWNGTLRKMACRLGDTPPHPPAPAHARCCCGLARAVPQLPPPCSQRSDSRDEVYRGSPLVWRLKVGMAASEPTMPERNCASGLQRALRSCAQVGGVGELQVAVPNWGTERLIAPLVVARRPSLRFLCITCLCASQT